MSQLFSLSLSLKIYTRKFVARYGCMTRASVLTWRQTRLKYKVFSVTRDALWMMWSYTRFGIFSWYSDIKKWFTILYPLQKTKQIDNSKQFNTHSSISGYDHSNLIIFQRKYKNSRKWHISVAPQKWTRHWITKCMVFSPMRFLSMFWSILYYVVFNR